MQTLGLTAAPLTPPTRRQTQRGLTLVELIVAFTVLSIVVLMAVPLARGRVKRERERELRIALSDIRHAIDRHKEMADANQIGPIKAGSEGYPESLEVLVKGVKKSGGGDVKIRFLRRLPKDPMTNGYDWGVRSMQDDPESQSSSGQNVFDVYTKSREVGSDGQPYYKW